MLVRQSTSPSPNVSVNRFQSQGQHVVWSSGQYNFQEIPDNSTPKNFKVEYCGWKSNAQATQTQIYKIFPLQYFLKLLRNHLKKQNISRVKDYFQSFKVDYFQSFKYILFESFKNQFISIASKINYFVKLKKLFPEIQKTKLFPEFQKQTFSTASKTHYFQSFKNKLFPVLQKQFIFQSFKSRLLPDFYKRDYFQASTVQKQITSGTSKTNYF